MASKRLVIKNLEKASWRVLEEHPDIVKELIRGRSGVYALYRRDKLYYIGLTSNLMARLRTHLRDRHRGLWDRFSVYLTVHDDHMKELESLMLRIISPPGNRVSGKFIKSENIQGELIRRIKENQADDLALLVGGRVFEFTSAERHPATRGLELLRVQRLAVDASKGWRKGYEYQASLRKNGTIYYDGEVYESPSAAGAAALGHRCNGWAFWMYKDEHGEWVPLRRLRKSPQRSA